MPVTNATRKHQQRNLDVLFWSKHLLGTVVHDMVCEVFEYCMNVRLQYLLSYIQLGFQRYKYRFLIGMDDKPSYENYLGIIIHKSSLT